MDEDELLVRDVARAMSVSNGFDPDEMVPLTGYAEDRNKLIPRWWREVEWAKRHIAASKVLKAESDKPSSD